MPSIKASAEAFANANLDQQLVAAANAATPAGITPAAEVIRDANGKVVQVNVHLPEGISKADLAAAKAAVDDNPGVAKASSFPIGGDEEQFSDLTPGTVFAATGVAVDKDLGGTIVTIDTIAGQNHTEWRAAQSADSVGGTGSALEMYDADTSLLWGQLGVMNGRLIAHPASNNLTTFGAFYTKLTIKAKDQGSPLGDTDNSTFIGFSTGAHSCTLINRKSYGDTNWRISMSGATQGTEIALGVSMYTEVTVEVGIDPAGLFYIKANGQTLSKSLGFVPQSSYISLTPSLSDSFSSDVSPVQQRSIIIDNVTMTILSGN